MSIIKVIELMSNSTKSWEDATQQAINEASKSVKNIKSVYVKDHCVLVENNKIKQYRVTVKLSFEIVEKTVLTKKK
jgi:flavin-binding protein dodecin